MTRPLSLCTLAAIVSCSVWPTGEDIQRGLDADLASVAGSWAAVHTTTDGSPSTLTMSYRLVDGGSGPVTGTGSMQERGAAALSTLAISGTYLRPDLNLVFDGMTYEGRSVRGTFHGRFTTVAGIGDTLVLTGTGYTRRLPMLLQRVGP